MTKRPNLYLVFTNLAEVKPTGTLCDPDGWTASDQGGEPVPQPVLHNHTGDEDDEVSNAEVDSQPVDEVVQGQFFPELTAILAHGLGQNERVNPGFKFIASFGCHCCY